MKLRTFVFIALCLALNQSWAHEPGAHVHGVATLQAALDGKSLSISFSSPLDNLIGFEHPARNAKEKAAVQSMIKTLQGADKLFLTSPGAQCHLKEVKLESAVIESNKKPDPAEAGHADVDADISFVCDQPAKLNSLEAALFSYYPNLHSLKVEVVTEKKPAAATLSPETRKISW